MHMIVLQHLQPATMTANITLSEVALKRAALLGESGQQWVDSLPALVQRILAQFGLTFVESLTGGSESFCALVRQRDDTHRVIKVIMPNDPDVTAEIPGLRAANGRGYAAMLASDADLGFVILEHLGRPIAQSNLATPQQLSQITAALKLSWQSPTTQPGLIDGSSKADWLYQHITKAPTRIATSVDSQLITKALDCIDRRRSLWRREDFVLVHGDAHEHNALRMPHTEDEQYKLVDPDGLVFEGAYDLGILLRNWIDAYKVVDPAAAMLQRADALASATEVQPGAIIDWGFIEVVSTGIHLIDLGYADEGKQYLDLGRATLPVV